MDSFSSYKEASYADSSMKFRDICDTWRTVVINLSDSRTWCSI